MSLKLWRRFRPIAVVIAITATAVVLSACGSGDDKSDVSTGNAVDSMFVNAMVPHHEGAIEMAKVAKKRSERKEILALADAILETQQSEIDQMKKLQEELPKSASSMMDGNQMSAMQAETAQLETVEEFDQAFIAAMIPHHQSAVEMAEKVITSGSNADVRQLAQNIITAQNDEIAQMEKWSMDWFDVVPSGATGQSMGHG